MHAVVSTSKHSDARGSSLYTTAAGGVVQEEETMIQPLIFPSSTVNWTSAAGVACVHSGCISLRLDQPLLRPD